MVFILFLSLFLSVLIILFAFFPISRAWFKTKSAAPRNPGYAEADFEPIYDDEEL